MQKVAFISRHVPSPEQVEYFARHNYELVHVGDANGFDIEVLRELTAPYLSACVVHAGAAANLLTLRKRVFVCENVNRAPAGEPPQFKLAKVYAWQWEYDDDEAREGHIQPIIMH